MRVWVVVIILANVVMAEHIVTYLESKCSPKAVVIIMSETGRDLIDSISLPIMKLVDPSGSLERRTGLFEELVVFSDHFDRLSLDFIRMISKRTHLIMLNKGVKEEYRSKIHDNFRWVYINKGGEIANQVDYSQEPIRNAFLNVGYTSPWPYLIMPNHPGEPVVGVDVNIVATLARKHGFAYQFFYTFNISPIKEGNRTILPGLVDKIFSGEIDLAIGRPAFDHQRSSFCDYSTQLGYHELVFFAREPALRGKSEAFLSTFDLWTWGMIVLALGGINVALFIIHKTHKMTSSVGDNLFFTLTTCAENSYGHKWEKRPLVASKTIVLIMWLVSVYWLTLAYESTLLANLTVNSYEAPIDTAEDVRRTNLPVFSVDGTLLAAGLKHSRRQILRDIYEFQVKGQNGLYYNDNIPPARVILVDAGQAIDTMVKVTGQVTAGWRAAKESYFSGPNGYIAPKGSHLFELINPDLEQLLAGGLPQKWEKDFVTASQRENKANVLGEEELNGKLALMVFRPVFFLGALGLGISILAFVVEHVGAFVSHT